MDSVEVTRVGLHFKRGASILDGSGEAWRAPTWTRLDGLTPILHSKRYLPVPESLEASMPAVFASCVIGKKEFWSLAADLSNEQWV